MDAQGRTEVGTVAAGGARYGGVSVAERGRHRLVGITPAELRRLNFVRWLREQGRLTEFPASAPVGAADDRRP